MSLLKFSNTFHARFCLVFLVLCVSFLSPRSSHFCLTGKGGLYLTFLFALTRAALYLTFSKMKLLHIWNHFWKPLFENHCSRIQCFLSYMWRINFFLTLSQTFASVKYHKNELLFKMRENQGGIQNKNPHFYY